MGSGGKDSGSDIDPDEIARVQAQFNRINQTTPFGSLQFSGDGRTRSTITLSPEQQALLDQQQRNQGIAGSIVAGQLAAGPDRSIVEQASFARDLGLLSPRFDLQENRLRQQLANQGLPQASNAFGAEVGRLGDARNQALQQAAFGAVLAGGQDESQQIAQILSLAGLAAPGVPTFFAPGSVTVPVGNEGGDGGLGALDPFGRIVGGFFGNRAGGGLLGGGVGTLTGGVTGAGFGSGGSI